MSTKSFLIPDDLYAYVTSTWIKETPALESLRAETQAMPEGRMQISPEQGQFMAILIKAINAKRTLEVGVFTGYSSTVTALALPPDGKLIACDVSEEFTSVARRAWKAAGVENKIELRLGPALETLDAMIRNGEGGFDFCFIDADKPNYAGYFERALKLVRRGGLIATDNVLWRGAVADQQDKDESTQAIRAYNSKVATDPRVETCILPIGDGLSLSLVK